MQRHATRRRSRRCASRSAWCANGALEACDAFRCGVHAIPRTPSACILPDDHGRVIRVRRTIVDAREQVRVNVDHGAATEESRDIARADEPRDLVRRRGDVSNAYVTSASTASRSSAVARSSDAVARKAREHSLRRRNQCRRGISHARGPPAPAPRGARAARAEGTARDAPASPGCSRPRELFAQHALQRRQRVR